MGSIHSVLTVSTSFPFRFPICFLAKIVEIVKSRVFSAQLANTKTVKFEFYMVCMADLQN